MIFGGRSKIRPTDDIISELRLLRQKYGFNSLLIHDDLFTLNKDQVLAFCKAYREGGFPRSFVCQARADFIVKNEDAVAEMAETGLKCFMIGFESGSQRVLDFLKKGTTVEQNRHAAEICRKYGISIFANYMFGIPTETAAEVRQTVNFIRQIKPRHPSPCFFTPYPGTELGEYCIKSDLLLEKSDGYYNRSAMAQGKLKGIDYNFLRVAVERSMDYDREWAAAGRRSRGILERIKAKLRGKGAGAFIMAAARYLRRRWSYIKCGL
jgi:radical SAM superfamily enzyme YgiQ (UPF0313 family)